MNRYLLFICPDETLPVAMVTIVEDDPDKARKTAFEAIDKWVETGKAVGFSQTKRPKAYLTPDVGTWL